MLIRVAETLVGEHTMSKTRLSLLALAVTTLCSTAALAQKPVDQTGTGGGPASTVTAPNTSSVGQTMPRPGGRDVDRNLDRKTQDDKKADKIMDGICKGC